MKQLLLAAALSGVFFPVPVMPVAPPPVTAYLGVYRGTVINDVDPMQIGRLDVEVPSVMGDVARWALPSVPYNGGALPALPPVGSVVWVQFEAGNPDYPIWTGWTTIAP